MKNKCALLIGALAIISALLIVPSYKVSAYTSNEIYSMYNVVVGSCNPYEWSQYNCCNFNTSISEDFTYANYTFNSSKPCLVYENWNMSTQYASKVYYIGKGTYSFLYDSGNGQYTLSSNSNLPTNIASSKMRALQCNVPIFNSLQQASLYSRGLAYDSSSIVGGQIPISYGIMNTNKGLKVNGADFSFYTSYNDNKFTIAYNYSLTNRDNSDSSLRIEAGDLLVFELYAKVPTKDFVDNYISQNGLGDATPSIIIDVARNLKNTTNIINTSSIPTTTVYGLNYYGYNENDAVEYDDAYYNFQYGNDQNGILTFRVTSSNNSASSPNLLAQLVSYYGSEREAILGSALGYIDYCRSYVVNIANNNWNVYNPYYTYFFQVKDDSGRNVIRANSFEGTPQQFTTNEVDDRENVGDFTIPANNPSDIQSSYTGGITNSYNNTYNNYYNTTQANQELLDYLYQFRDGGQQEDIQNAYGYLNSTIDSVSNVPVVIGKLFYGFFPPQVILLFNAMFIIFAVFIIIKIIRHLFL